MSETTTFVLTRCAQWLLFIFCVVLIPPVCLGIIRKTKARLQNRIGAPILQPLFDLLKLLRKGETLSTTMSGVFRLSSVLILGTIVLLAWIAPWLNFKPWSPNADLFLIVYFFALAKVFSLLGSLDSGSAFGAFAASREATLGLLVEPAMLLALVALALFCGTTDLRMIFAYGAAGGNAAAGSFAASAVPVIWVLVGFSILLSSLVELSRMPVDDPTTHLELTMVHEAMILEASGRNLALIEFAHALKMSIFFGLTSQCFLHALSTVWKMDAVTRGVMNVGGICCIAIAVGVFEGLSVKLQWRKVPEFVAYVVSMSLLAAFVAAGIGAVKL